MVWKCPNCDQVLARSDKQWACANGHSFDIAKQGYVNLLLSQHKSTQNPGDNDEMLAARRRFLNGGFYDQLSKAIAGVVVNEGTILDLGCGEGFYLQAILKEKEPHALTALGIEIAKTGVRQAAIACKHGTTVHLAVANTYKIPVPDQSVDQVLSIFAPFCPTEASRILKNTGSLVRIGPGPTHLHQIKAALYDSTKQHPSPATLADFTRQQERRVTYDRQLDGTIITQDLIPMTPLHWQGSRESKNALASGDALGVTFDFIIEVFTKNALTL